MKCGSNREAYYSWEATFQSLYGDDAERCCKPPSGGWGSGSSSGFAVGSDGSSCAECHAACDEAAAVPQSATFFVSESGMSYDAGRQYCMSRGGSLAAIYSVEELATARGAISAAGVEKAITSAVSHGVGWSWGGMEPWSEGGFPLNTGQVHDQRQGAAGHIYSLHRAEDSFVWDADMRSEVHRVLCRGGPWMGYSSGAPPSAPSVAPISLAVLSGGWAVNDDMPVGHPYLSRRPSAPPERIALIASRF